MNQNQINSSPFRAVILSILVISFLSSCDVFNSNEKIATLDFDKVQIQYSKYGGWINTSQLEIQSSGEASAVLLAQGSREVLNQNITVLTELQKEHLAQSFASFSTFNRHYKPKEHFKDENYYKLILSYEGITDTVTVYNLSRVSMPKDLRQLILDIDEIHQSILD